MDNATIEQARRELVARLKQQGYLRDTRLQEAFEAVPRHLFLPELAPELAYADEALPIKYDDDGAVLSSSSQPGMMALMLNQLRLHPGANVLEIGTGTGYNAAIMQQIVKKKGHVTSIELDAEVHQQAAKNLQRAGVHDVFLVNADGAMGYAPRAAYDRIIATAGIWDVPRAWAQQLRPDGILVAPIWVDALQYSAALRPQKDGSLYSAINLPCGFIHLRGMAAAPRLHVRVGGSALVLGGNAVTQMDSAMLHSLFSEDAEACHLGERLTPEDYWNHLLTYLMLNPPPDFAFMSFSVSREQQAYGMEGHGFGLVANSSACLVPYQGHGEAYCFGGADAFIALQAALKQWNALERPGRDVLRLCLSVGEPTKPHGTVYKRHDHYLDVWQDAAS